MKYPTYYLHNPYRDEETGRFDFKPGGTVDGKKKQMPRSEVAKLPNKQKLVAATAMVPVSELASIKDFDTIKHKTDRKLLMLKRALMVTASVSIAVAAGNALMHSYSNSQEDKKRLQVLAEGASAARRPMSKAELEKYAPPTATVEKKIVAVQPSTSNELLKGAAASDEPPEDPAEALPPPPPGVDEAEWARIVAAWRSDLPKTAMRGQAKYVFKTRSPIFIKRASAPPVLESKLRNRDAQDSAVTIKLPKDPNAVPGDVYEPPAPDERLSGAKGPLFNKPLVTIFDVVHAEPADKRSSGSALSTEFIIKDEKVRTEEVITTLRTVLDTTPEAYMHTHYGKRPDTSHIGAEDIAGFDEKQVKLYRQLVSARRQIADIDASFSSSLATETDPAVLSSTLKEWDEAKGILLQQELLVANELAKQVDTIQKPLVDARAWDVCHRQVVAQQQAMYDQLVRAMRYYDALHTLEVASNGERTATLEDVILAQDMVEGRRQELVSKHTTYDNLMDFALNKATPLTAYAAVAQVTSAIRDDIARVESDITRSAAFINADPASYLATSRGIYRPDRENYDSKYNTDLTTKRNILTTRGPQNKAKSDGDDQRLRPGANRKASVDGGKTVLVSTGAPTDEGMLAKISDEETDSGLGVIAHLVARQAAGGGADILGDAITTNYTASLSSWKAAMANIQQQQADLKESGYLKTQHARLQQLENQFDLCMMVLEDLENADPVVAEMASVNHSSLYKLLVKEPFRDSDAMNRYPATGKPTLGEPQEIRRAARQWDYDPDDPRQPSRLGEINSSRKYMTLARFPKLRAIWAQEEAEKQAALAEARQRVEARERRLRELQATPEGRKQLAAERAAQKRQEAKWAREDKRRKAAKIKRAQQQIAKEDARIEELVKHKKAKAKAAKERAARERELGY